MAKKKNTNKENTIKIKKDDKTLEVPERQYRVFYKNLGYEPTGTSTNKKSTKKGD